MLIVEEDTMLNVLTDTMYQAQFKSRYHVETGTMLIILSIVCDCTLVTANL